MKLSGKLKGNETIIDLTFRFNFALKVQTVSFSKDQNPAVFICICLLDHCFYINHVFYQYSSMYNIIVFYYHKYSIFCTMKNCTSKNWLQRNSDRIPYGITSLRWSFANQSERDVNIQTICSRFWGTLIILNVAFKVCPGISSWWYHVYFLIQIHTRNLHKTTENVQSLQFRTRYYF